LILRLPTEPFASGSGGGRQSRFSHCGLIRGVARDTRRFPQTSSAHIRRVYRVLCRTTIVLQGRWPEIIHVREATLIRQALNHLPGANRMPSKEPPGSSFD
jgi:hypothetical protein